MIIVLMLQSDTCKVLVLISQNEWNKNNVTYMSHSLNIISENCNFDYNFSIINNILLEQSKYII